MADPDLQTLRNRTFDELQVGDSASVQHTLGTQDIQLFAALCGDVDPQHFDAGSAGAQRQHGVTAHGMLGGAWISALIGSRLPGPGTVTLGQTLRFLAPVHVGDTVQVRVEVTSRDTARQRLLLGCSVTDAQGVTVIEGEAEVLAPSERITRPRTTLPELRWNSGHEGLQQLLAQVRPLGPIRMAVVHPCDALSLRGALDAHAAGLIEPVLIAPRARLEAAVMAAGLQPDDLADIEVIDVPHSHAGATRGAELAAQGKVEALMKGSLHTDELMAAVVPSAAGLRTKRRISHCFLMQTPAYPRPFIITDAAINIAPTLADKADIVQNAIELAHAIGVARPRVAILAAVETVNAAMPATLDAAALCKMADRGQITGGLLDGPLAFDNAVSLAAAKVKGIESEVAGQADVLVVPDLESGNMLAKQLEYLGDAASAGIVLGARVPIVLTSRADSREARIASCALASLLAHAYRSAPP